MRISLWVVVLIAASVELHGQDASYEYQDRGTVQLTVEEVMARPEFERLRSGEDEPSENPAWLERILEWIEGWFASDGESAGRDVGVGPRYLVYGLAFLIVVAALAFIVKAVLESTGESELTDEHDDAHIVRAGAAPGETPPEEFWARAHALAASGDEKLAIRELLLGAMSTLERRGLIRHRRGLTNRDYFWAAPGAMRSSLATIISAFERVYFGRRVANADTFRECADAYRVGFAVASTAPHEPLGSGSA